MDQSLSLPAHSAPASPSSVPACAAELPNQAAIADEDPESPGRSPRLQASLHAGPDPLAEGLALLSGVVLALMTVLVPLAAVVGEAQGPESSQIVRSSW